MSPCPSKYPRLDAGHYIDLEAHVDQSLLEHKDEEGSDDQGLFFAIYVH
jgi:hypothetical protein